MAMKKALIFVLVLTILVIPVLSFIILGVEYSVHGWTTNPAAMITKILFSFLFGQAIFWIIGYDQFGLFMDPKKQLGFGQRIAEWVANKLNRTNTLAWTVKIIEIITDAGKIVTEGFLYIRSGFAPDALAVLVTQPLFSTIETAEKITGAIVNPQKVNTDDQLKLSIGCIYGSLFRYFMAGFLWVFGTGIYQFLGLPVETIIRSAFK
jgi:hypothetical protein